MAVLALCVSLSPHQQKTDLEDQYCGNGIASDTSIPYGYQVHNFCFLVKQKQQQHQQQRFIYFLLKRQLHRAREKQRLSIHVLVHSLEATSAADE